MAWPDRLNPVIILISPLYSFFQAKWVGSNRQITKKIGQFNYPKFAGTITQDLDVVSTLYPMTIYFDGPNHDREANRFLKAFKETGEWIVIHPLTVVGQISLQPLSIAVVDAPVESANVTAIELEWIEPADAFSILSADLLSFSILDSILAAVENIGDTFAAIIQTAFAPIQAVRDTIDRCVAIINSDTSILSPLVAEINKQVQQITRTIDSLLDESILNPIELANSLYQLVQLPSTVSENFEDRFDSYDSITDNVIDLQIDSDNIGEAGYNTVLSQEMTLSMNAMVVASIVATSEFTTGSQVVDAINKVTDTMDKIIENLDTQQEYFENLDIDQQYFPMKDSYNSIMVVMSQVLKFLTLTTFSSKVEKRFVLEKDRSPIEITVTEYGTLGEDDANLNLFISSNNLIGNSIELVPAGTEVVIYAS